VGKEKRKENPDLYKPRHLGEGKAFPFLMSSPFQREERRKSNRLTIQRGKKKKAAQRWLLRQGNRRNFSSLSPIFVREEKGKYIFLFPPR